MEAGDSVQGFQGATRGLEKLPDHPGEDAFSHEGTLWIEQAERILARLRLLGVANGDEPDEAKARMVHCKLHDGTLQVT